VQVVFKNLEVVFKNLEVVFKNLEVVFKNPAQFLLLFTMILKGSWR